MEKHSWEVLSISLEYLAFFLAAPDFLGETTLNSMKTFTAYWLSYPDRFFKWAGDGIARRMPIIGGKQTSARGFILIVFIVDAFGAGYFGIAHVFFGTPFSIDYARSHGMPIVDLLLLANVAAGLYAVHLIFHGVASLGGKGLFFLFGALTFTASKAIAICVVRGYLGSTHAVVHDVIHEIAPALYG